ncbi:MICOS complex subunit MIC13 homolog QIL1 [Drosophila ficusphila]|uniref:MICOS complex subunit MIC13 homolog QIL1 n=1 Tax=Drosophila ficusphila TaxID=30025 RepID=UPI0007E5F19B|nr:MICOS complex subunit MIC13 homolog QIL1 [Drosophila ficusphila]XP_017052124.1 MICOS complex subunit MIC13 homolog QIL1 [Drosophila ficusphila]XP_017052125.1 MICOS complex subunit MIC13 homolog QIL1 [Drosophila ficusphila]
MFTTLMARTAALSMTVYLTSRIGVWGKTEESDRLLRQVTTGLHPLTGFLRRVLPFEQSDLSVGQLAREYYNQGVKGTFYIIRNIPNYSGDLAENAKLGYYDLVQKSQELRHQNIGWLNTSKDIGKPKDQLKDPAAGDGLSKEFVVIERPGIIEEFSGDGKVVLKHSAE